MDSSSDLSLLGFDLSLFGAEFFSALVAPLLYPFDPSRRVFVGFLLVALLMAYFVYPTQGEKRSIRNFLGYFFQKGIWLHKSSMLDFKLLTANSVFVGLVLAPLIIAKLSVIVFVSGGLRTEFGPLEQSVLPYFVIVLLFTFVVFFAEDFNRFFLHLCYHRIPFLWEFHKVHHSAEVLTPFTLYRIHPMEIVISRAGSVLMLGVVTGVFVYLFPGQLSALEILGVDLLGFIFNALGANLRHSHIPFSFGKLDKWFISPHMHQLHHSQLTHHHDKNYGSCFAIWDRMFGSLYIPARDEQLKFGCSQGGEHTLMSQWFSPFQRLYVRFMRRAKVQPVVVE